MQRKAKKIINHRLSQTKNKTKDNRTLPGLESAEDKDQRR